MIALVKGILESVEEDRVVVETGGIGFEILVPGSVMQSLPAAGNPVKIHTYTHVREDAIQLFGFLQRSELAMFKLLIRVNGIGPKAALGILSAMDADTLRFAIVSGDSRTISKAPGIGPKTAEKLILELRDKIDLSDVNLGGETDSENMPSGRTSDGGAADEGTAGGAGAGSSARDDAMQALVALGYSMTEAAAAVRRAGATPDMTVEEILKRSLRHI